MTWPGEVREDVGSAARFQNLPHLPAPEGTVPEPLPPEEYAAPETEGGGEGESGIGDIQIEGETGRTGETPMPFDIPQVDPGGMGISLPDLPGLPAEDFPLEQEEGTLSPDILPAKPFSIEGTEENDNTPANVPAAEEKPLSQNQFEIAPLPATEAPIQLGKAPLPTSESSSLVIQESAPLSSVFQPIPSAASVPSYAPAPLPSVRPSSYLPSYQTAPIVDTAPTYSDQQTDQQKTPISDEWRSRRTRSVEPAPLPTTEAPIEGRHVTYELTPEAPMPEVTRVPVVLEKAKPLALEGYCPVELVLNERWIEGDAKWTATHDGRNYQFSSREAFDSFCRSPELYAPYYGGVDPIISLVGGGMVDGRTDLCAVYRGRLYMFSSQESLEQFRAHPTQCVEAFTANLNVK